MEIVKASKVLTTRHKTMKLTGPYPKLFGELPANVRIFASGAPGSGKSTMATLFLNNVAENEGKVLYLPYEEVDENGEKPTLTRRLNLVESCKPLHNRFDLVRKDLPTNLLAPEVLAILGRYKMIAIDSLQKAHITNDAWDGLMEALPMVGWYVIAQLNNKDKAGYRHIEHDCDISMVAKKGIARLTKNRLGLLNEAIIYYPKGTKIQINQ